METEISLSLFYNGQFFTALLERNDEAGYSVCQKIFAVDPSDYEVKQFVLEAYYSLSFSKPTKGEEAFIKPFKNPKRRQREAANATKNVCASTKAQEALKKQYEINKTVLKSLTAEDKRRRFDGLYELKVIKRKQKHKGR